MACWNVEGTRCERGNDHRDGQPEFPGGQTVDRRPLGTRPINRLPLRHRWKPNNRSASAALRSAHERQRALFGVVSTRGRCTTFCTTCRHGLAIVADLALGGRSAGSHRPTHLSAGAHPAPSEAAEIAGKAASRLAEVPWWPESSLTRPPVRRHICAVPSPEISRPTRHNA